MLTPPLPCPSRKKPALNQGREARMFVRAVNPPLPRNPWQDMEVPRLQVEGELSGESSSSLYSKLHRPERRSFGGLTPTRPDKSNTVCGHSPTLARYCVDVIRPTAVSANQSRTGYDSAVFTPSSVPNLVLEHALIRIKRPATTSREKCSPRSL